MNNIFILPANNTEGRKHYEKTIATGCKLNAIKKFLNTDIINILREAYPDEICHIWGAAIGGTNQGTWNNMQTGDLTLSYWGKTIRSASFVIAKTKNSSLADYLWDNPQKPHELIFFLTKPQMCEITLKELGDLGTSYARFNRIDKSIVKKILEKIRLFPTIC